jgi:hypothetical protein
MGIYGEESSMWSTQSRFTAVTRSLAIFMAVLLTATVAGPAPASAHFFDSTKMDDSWVDFGSDEDNQDHFLFWNHFVNRQMFEQYLPRTDLSGVEHCQHCWNDGTDIVWFAFPIPNNSSGAVVYGDWSCRKVRSNGKCERGRLRFQESLTRGISNSAAFAITCHEIGHGIGFDHYNDGCMHTSMSLVYPFTNVLSSHMITHINQQY